MASISVNEARELAAQWQGENNLLMISREEMKRILRRLAKDGVDENDFIGCIFCMYEGSQSLILFPAKGNGTNEAFDDFEFLGSYKQSAGHIQETWIKPTRPNGESNQDIINYFFPEESS